MDLSSTKDTRDIQCPFFKRHDATEIRCEGIMDGATTGVHFRTPKLKNFFQSNYCEREYKKCEIYLMLMREKYEES